MVVRTLCRLGISSLAMLTAISATPILAQTANFGSASLAPGFEPSTGELSGQTGGSYSLSSIANRDRNNSRCFGFGDPTPDHVLTLQQDFPNLKILVNSAGYDTTLVIQGPDKTVRCGDDTARKKDASVEDSNWKAGEYRIWVGSFDSGVERRYTLSVRE